MKWKFFSPRHLHWVCFSAIAFFALGAGQASAQRVSLESLRRDGYGVVTLQRPRPNALTILVDIDNQKHRLLLDSGWLGDGIGLLHGEEAPTSSIVTGSQLPIVTGGATVTLGNVRLTHVPVRQVALPVIASDVTRRIIGADGVIGLGFLRTCSAFVDLENLRLYLRPPGEGRRVRMGPAMARVGLAEIPFLGGGREAPVVNAEVNGFAGRMLVDTGTYLSIVDRGFAGEIHARPISTNLGHPRPRTQDEFAVVTRIDEPSLEAHTLIGNTTSTPLQSLKLGGVAVRAPDIRIGALAQPAGRGQQVMGKVGVDILGRNGAILDFAEGKLFLIPE